MTGAEVFRLVQIRKIEAGVVAGPAIIKFIYIGSLYQIHRKVYCPYQYKCKSAAMEQLPIHDIWSKKYL